jgi:hypothetical protein
MKPTRKSIQVCLLCGLGFVLLLGAILPYQSRNAIPSQNGVTSTKNHSNIRFSEQRTRLEPVHSGEIASGFILVENTGGKIITDVAIKAGCWCSDVQLSKTEMNPGDSIRIDFSIDTKGKDEDFVDNFLFTYSKNEQNLYDVFQVTVPCTRQVGCETFIVAVYTRYG